MEFPQQLGNQHRGNSAVPCKMHIFPENGFGEYCRGIGARASIDQIIIHFVAQPL
jgi:hypothetical protein